MIATVATVQSPANAQTGSARDTSPDAAFAQKAPPAPPLQIAGYWNGTLQDPEHGMGDLSIFFTEKSAAKKSPR
jgi:hypothetical protein